MFLISRIFCAGRDCSAIAISRNCLVSCLKSGLQKNTIKKTQCSTLREMPSHQYEGVASLCVNNEFSNVEIPFNAILYDHHFSIETNFDFEKSNKEKLQTVIPCLGFPLFNPRQICLLLITLVFRFISLSAYQVLCALRQLLMK